MARSMVTEYGMSDRFGPHALGRAPRSLFLGDGMNGAAAGLDISEATQREVDEEVEKILGRRLCVRDGDIDRKTR